MGTYYVYLNSYIALVRASLVAQRVKCLPVMQETWVQSLGWEDPLKEVMATHSSILALSMGFSRQEYWRGLPFLPPRHLPNPGTEPRSPALQEGSLPSEPPGKSH